jgi:hypothetical protein
MHPRGVTAPTLHSYSGRDAAQALAPYGPARQADREQTQESLRGIVVSMQGI